ncbi:YqaA family protein [Halocatena marina]|uniref:YqaA family protein n=1 Tax=Halocatena marina TaxID=2934937 RepID=A0ABD5YRM3_9EURY
MDPSTPFLCAFQAVFLQGGFLGLERMVEQATGPIGLLIIFVYSFLIAIILPLPSEVVLAAPLDLGLPKWMTMALIVVVSGVGKSIGSVLALRIGNEAKKAGPVMRALNRTGIDVVGISQRKTVAIAQQYGYIGLALALCIPGFPDTLSIYAFTVLEEDYAKFAVATFIGSVGRLIVWLAGIEIVFLFF